MSLVQTLSDNGLIDIPLRAMHWAIDNADLAFVKELWTTCNGKFSDDHRCDCGCCSKLDYFPDFGDRALRKGDIPLAEFFLSVDAMFSACAIAHASASGKLDVVKWIVEHHEKPHIIRSVCGDRNFLPTDYSFGRDLGWGLVRGANSLDIVEYLHAKIREYGHELSDQHRSEAIEYARAKNNDAVVAFLS